MKITFTTFILELSLSSDEKIKELLKLKLGIFIQTKKKVRSRSRSS
jgi:hypothetical protein